MLFLRLVLTFDDSLDQSVVRSSLPLAELWRHALSFAVLAALAGAACCGQLFMRRWRWLAEYVLLIAIVAVIIGVFADSGSQRFGELAALGVGAAAALFLWRVAANSKVARASRPLRAPLIQPSACAVLYRTRSG